MAGGPDPAFLHNVPTSLFTTATSSSATSASSTSSSTSSSSSTTPTSSPSSRSSSTTTTSSSLTSTSTTPSPTTTSTTSTGTTTSPTPSSTSTLDSLNLPPSVYAYAPSTALTILFSILFGALIPHHFYLSIYKPHIRKSVSQKHSYTIPLFVTCILSTIGFSIRIISIAPSNRISISLYAVSQTFIIVAPIFACATLYLLIAHLIDLCLPPGKDRTFLGINSRWLGRIFITSDVLSFLLQGAGSAIAFSAKGQDSKRDTGTNILVFGLAVQLATFTLYLLILALFCHRVQSGHETDRQDEKTRDKDNSMRRDFGFNPLVKQVVKGVWIASVLIHIRSVFRTVEFAAGANGYPFRHEWTLWVFDAAPIWLALLVLGIYHPTKWLQSKRRSWFVEKNARHTVQR